MLKKDKEDFFDKRFRLLLGDAILLIEEAEKEREKAARLIKPGAHHHNFESFLHRTREATFSRAAIINSVLMLESSANCCIYQLDLQSRYFSDIDKLPVLSKFEFYLQRVNAENTLDRGATIIQKANELIGVRNLLVHPKPYKSQYRKIEENQFSIDLGETQFLKLPRSFLLCKHQYALDGFKAAMSFLNFFFLSLCSYNFHKVNNILLGDEVESTHLHDWIQIHEKWDVDVDFLIDVVMVKQGEAKFREHLKNEAKKEAHE